MEWLKAILGEDNQELFDKISAALPEHTVEKAKYDELEAQSKANYDQLQTANDTIKEMGEQKGTSEELEAKLTELQTKYDDAVASHAKEIGDGKKLTALEKLFKGANASEEALDLLVNAQDLEKVTLADDGSIVDADKIIADSKGKRASLFGEVKVETEKPGDHKTTDTETQVDDNAARRVVGLPPV